MTGKTVDAPPIQNIATDLQAAFNQQLSRSPVKIVDNAINYEVTGLRDGLFTATANGEDVQLPCTLHYAQLLFAAWFSVTARKMGA